MWVVFFHLYTGTLFRPLSSVFPSTVRWTFQHGALGVQIFFVISGFASAWSVRKAEITGSFTLEFLRRRMVRLAPPYWVALALAIANLEFSNLRHAGAHALPSAGSLLAHVFYLQGLIGFKDIVPVFWTLCIEVQLYLAFILTLLIAWKIGCARLAVLAPTAIVSAALLAWTGDTTGSSATSPWFIHFWHLFVLGALSAWVYEKALDAKWLLGYLALVLIAGTRSRDPGAYIGVLTTAIIWASHSNGALRRTLESRPLQYLGMISYSLYLIHYDVGYRFLNVGQKWTGDSSNAALGWFASGLVASILAAHVLYRLVERPSLRLSRALSSAGDQSRQQLRVQD